MGAGQCGNMVQSPSALDASHTCAHCSKRRCTNHPEPIVQQSYVQRVVDRAVREYRGAPGLLTFHEEILGLSGGISGTIAGAYFTTGFYKPGLRLVQNRWLAAVCISPIVIGGMALGMGIGSAFVPGLGQWGVRVQSVTHGIVEEAMQPAVLPVMCDEAGRRRREDDGTR